MPCVTPKKVFSHIGNVNVLYQHTFSAFWFTSALHLLCTTMFQGGCRTLEPVQPECDPQEKVF